jgi:hypothetical protein
MKKLFTLLTTFTLSILFAAAQQANTMVSQSKSYESVAQAARHQGPGGNSTQALWDIQFSHNLDMAVTMVSCVYTGTEFWVGRFDCDTLYALDTMGNVTATFRVTGVGSSTVGVRGLTYDGTNVFATTGTNKTIYKIDPVARTLVSSTNANSVAFNFRSIAFDSTANAGAGGFWVSNFGSAFVLVSRTGAVLQTIPAGTHGLTGVYGICFDPYTSGGPYLWAFDQQGGTDAILKRVKTSTGLVSPIGHDVNADFGGGGISGNVSITWRYRPGTWTLMGVSQATPDLLFGYELNELPVLDAMPYTLTWDPPYTIIPALEVVPYNWTVQSANVGQNTITNLTTEFRLTDSIVDYFSPPAATDVNVATLNLTTNSFGPFTPSMGLYYMQANVNTGSQTDLIPTNDTMTVSFLNVSDSVYARENGVALSGLGIGDGTGGTLGQYFTLSQSAYITSATFLLTAPTDGDFTSVSLYSFVDTPIAILATSDLYQFSGSDSDGVVLTLPFNTGPYLATPGDYFLGVNEFSNNVTLGRTAFNYRPLTGFITFTGQPWAPSEDFGFNVTYLLRMNIDPNTVGVKERLSSQFTIFPNPSTGKVHIHNDVKGEEYQISVFNNMGEMVMQKTVNGVANSSIDLGSHANGVYQVQVKSKLSTTNTSVVISHN